MRPSPTTDVLTPEGAASTPSTPCQIPTESRRNEHTTQSSNSPEGIGQTLNQTVNAPGSLSTVNFINQFFTTNAPSDINTGNKNSSAHQSSFGGVSSSSLSNSNVDVSSTSNAAAAPNDIPANQRVSCSSQKMSQVPAETDQGNQTTPSCFASQDSRDEDHSPLVGINQMPAVTEKKQMANKPSDGVKCHGSEGNKMATKRKITDKAKKTKSQKKTPRKSSLKEFEEYAKLDLIKRGYPKSTKPHLLLQTVEFAVYHGQRRKAGAALQKALTHWQTHSRPSSEELLKLTNQCTNSRAPLRAVLFHVLVAAKMKAERAENGKYCFLLSEHIFEVWCLLQKMRQAEERKDMNNGVHYKQVAKFVPPLMSRIYDLGCDEASAKCKGYALSWIAVAHSHNADYRNAFEFGEKGRGILDKEFPQIEDRHKEQSYSRLLECVGLGYEKSKRQFPEALKIFEESVVATRAAKYDDDDESKRETALSIRSRHVQRVQKTITSQCKKK